MPVFDRAFDVMEYVNGRGAARVGDLCADLKLPRPTAHRLLSLLERRGYVQHDPSMHLYVPGPGLLRLAAQRPVSSLVQCAEPALVRLREETRETVNLGVLQGGRIVYAATLDGVLMPKMSVMVGQDVPPHATAIGKAILATLSDQERSRFLGREPYPRYTRRTITSRSSLDAELSSIAEQGYAIDAEEVDVGAVCVAAVVRCPDGEALGAMSVSASAARVTPEACGNLGKLIVAWCDHVSAMLVAQGATPVPARSRDDTQSSSLAARSRGARPLGSQTSTSRVMRRNVIAP